MKRMIVLITVIGIGVGVFFFQKSHSQPDAATAGVTDEQPNVDIRVEAYTVTDEDTFTTAMEALGIDYATALEIVEAATDVIDFTSIRVGKVFRLVYEDDVPVRIEFEPGTETIYTVDLLNNYFTGTAPIPYDIAIETVDVTITDSLFLSGLDAGLNEVLMLQFVDIFAWEVDFATQVQTGDTFSVTYEKRFRNGKEAGVGDVLFGQFVNVGESSTAYRFLTAEGSTSYYTPEGNALVRAFLKAPLSYSRITSGYTNARFHPVLQSTTPHRAIDYAAPIGTPVMAVADGVVTVARWNGGFGNYVDIRHNSVYETQYAHLSKILVSQGQSVKQGDVIGLVGSTGFSTGPHLHYQVEVNGELQNPLEVEFPAGDAVAEDQMDEFNRQKTEIDQIR